MQQPGFWSWASCMHGHHAFCEIIHACPFLSMPHMSHQMALKSHSSSEHPIRHSMCKVTVSGSGPDVIDLICLIPGTSVIEHLGSPSENMGPWTKIKPFFVHVDAAFKAHRQPHIIECDMKCMNCIWSLCLPGKPVNSTKTKRMPRTFAGPR